MAHHAGCAGRSARVGERVEAQNAAFPGVLSRVDREDVAVFREGDTAGFVVLAAERFGEEARIGIGEPAQEWHRRFER